MYGHGEFGLMLISSQSMAAICDWDFGMTPSLDLIKVLLDYETETCKIWTELEKNQKVSFSEQIWSLHEVPAVLRTKFCKVCP